MGERPVEPFAITQLVDMFVDEELRDAAKYSNRSPLDDSGVYALHDLAARIYAIGFNEGCASEGWRQNSRRQRARDAARAEAETAIPGEGETNA